jgi:hypothetical protein
VNYEKKTPCLLEIDPTLGRHRKSAARSRRFTRVLPHENFDRERSGLACAGCIIIAPWAENPFMLHVARRTNAR